MLDVKALRYTFFSFDFKYEKLVEEFRFIVYTIQAFFCFEYSFPGFLIDNEYTMTHFKAKQFNPILATPNDLIQ